MVYIRDVYHTLLKQHPCPWLNNLNNKLKFKLLNEITTTCLVLLPARAIYIYYFRTLCHNFRFHRRKNMPLSFKILVVYCLQPEEKCFMKKKSFLGDVLFSPNDPLVLVFKKVICKHIVGTSLSGEVQNAWRINLTTQQEDIPLQTAHCLNRVVRWE